MVTLFASHSKIAANNCLIRPQYTYRLDGYFQRSNPNRPDEVLALWCCVAPESSEMLDPNFREKRKCKMPLDLTEAPLTFSVIINIQHGRPSPLATAVDMMTSLTLLSHFVLAFLLIIINMS